MYLFRLLAWKTYRDCYLKDTLQFKKSKAFLFCLIGIKILDLQTINSIFNIYTLPQISTILNSRI